MEEPAGREKRMDRGRGKRRREEGQMTNRIDFIEKGKNSSNKVFREYLLKDLGTERFVSSSASLITFTPVARG